MRALLVAAVVLVGCSASDDIPAPMIAAVTPDHGPIGAIVTISGNYFCQRPETGQEDPTCDTAGAVHFGTAPGIPSSWTDVAIMVEVPSLAPGRADISVAIKGRTSNAVAFTAD